MNFTVHKLPRFLPMAGLTLGHHVFLRDVTDKLTLEHELVHVGQQTGHGFFASAWWWIAYLLLLPLGWNPWRTRLEAEAYAVQARAGCPIDGDDGLAAYLAGPAYGWCCSRTTAERLIHAFLAASP